MTREPFGSHLSSAPPVILALGDSLMAGYGLPRDASFPARLEALLAERWAGACVINAGVSGDTTNGALARLPGVLSRLRRLPDLAIVGLGANDVLRGIAPARTRTNLGRIVDELARCKIPALLATIEPPPFMRPLVASYATIYAEVAAEHAIPHHPFFPAGVLGHAAMVLPDQLHPNAAAIDRCARYMLPAVVEALERTRSAAAARGRDQAVDPRR